jgi:Uma2 family endonuclease
MTLATGYSIPQEDPPRSPRETLPTMYDLPSEFPEEPGLPDVFHDLQPQLLSRTLRLTDYSQDNYFTASDLNLYYDVHHPLWHKRPDWFLAVGVPFLYDGHDLRRSYVVWQEGQAPDLVIEFLSPRTEREDLGRFFEERDWISENTRNLELEPNSEERAVRPDELTLPPSKLTVYETYLRVPHYIVYSRYTQRLRYFKLVGSQYQEQPVGNTAPMIWLTDLNLGLGIWLGTFEHTQGHWLRWCDEAGQWFLTDTEQERLAKEQERLAKEQERLAKEQERLAKEQERQRAEKLAAKLRELGMNPDDV